MIAPTPIHCITPSDFPPRGSYPRRRRRADFDRDNLQGRDALVSGRSCHLLSTLSEFLFRKIWKIENASMRGKTRRERRTGTSCAIASAHHVREFLGDVRASFAFIYRLRSPTTGSSLFPNNARARARGSPCRPPVTSSESPTERAAKAS